MNSKKAQISIIAIFLVFTFSLTAAFFIVPKSDYSSVEKRYLAPFPELSISNFLRGGVTKGLEGDENQSGYIPDHFPFRSFFVGLNSYANLLLGATASSDYYYAEDGYIITKPSEYGVADQNLKLIRKFAASFDEVSLVVVPSAGYILEDKLPLNHTNYPDEAVYSMIERDKGDNVKFVDLVDAFRQASDEGKQLYYKTDHHWTSEGAYLGYSLICDSLGLTSVSKEDFTVTSYDNFYGTTYSSSGYYLRDPDTLEIWEKTSPHLIDVTITDGAVSETYDSMYFTSHLEEEDMYPVFLDGNHSLVEIRNYSSSSNKTLVIIKDSFAHCTAPFLANNYSRVIMVDMRYYKDSMSKFAGEDTDILFLYGMENFTEDKNLTFLE